ncbi:MAG: WYL domain-containing protein [Deltaproteobacteria bacterium]|nr:WYL domain-containing protein [Deltaproteobacteria bacterium]
MRTFTLDRIKMLTVTDERFTPPKDFEVENLMRYGFKVIHDELYTVMVKISADWARWVGKEIWHENQKARKMRVAGLDEINGWILSFGPEAVVLEPPKLQEMVRKDLSKNLTQYSPSTVSMELMKEMRAV